MKTTPKSLHKLTDTETKINGILSLKEISPTDIEPLSRDERDCLSNVLAEKVITLTGIERDEFYSKIDPIVTDATKNQRWESNHHQITWAISSLLFDYQRMPTVTEIGRKAELTRQTVHKHLKDYTNHPIYLQQLEQFRFMTQKVLSRVYVCAEQGDMAAAKLYFNVLGNLNGQLSNNTLIQNQNNYIQINGTVLSQETIKRLNPDQLNTIENILKTALPQAETLNPAPGDQLIPKSKEIFISDL